MIRSRKLLRLAHLAIQILACSSALAQTPTKDEAEYEEMVEKVLNELPDGTKHEFVMMPLRDGVKVATDIFIPEGSGPWPVALLRRLWSSRYWLRPSMAVRIAAVTDPEVFAAVVAASPVASAQQPDPGPPVAPPPTGGQVDEAKISATFSVLSGVTPNR